MNVSCEMIGLFCQIKKMHTETEQELLHRGYSDHIKTSAFIHLYSCFRAEVHTQAVHAYMWSVVFTTFKKFRMSLMVKACILSHFQPFP